MRLRFGPCVAGHAGGVGRELLRPAGSRKEVADAGHRLDRVGVAAVGLRPDQPLDLPLVDWDGVARMSVLPRCGEPHPEAVRHARLDRLFARPPKDGWPKRWPTFEAPQRGRRRTHGWPAAREPTGRAILPVPRVLGRRRLLLAVGMTPVTTLTAAARSCASSASPCAPETRARRATIGAIRCA